MTHFIRKSSILFALGAFGGLVAAAVIWISGLVGLTGLFGVSMAPEFTSAFVYPKIVWGGIWGWLGFLPLLVTGWVARGVAISIVPAAASWFVFLPLDGAGLLGLSLGLLTPLVVLAFTMVWGLVTEGLAEMCGVYDASVGDVPAVPSA